MTTDPEKVPAWILSFLRLHVESLIAAVDIRYQQRFDAQEKAISKAEAAAEKRFDSVNEFRGQQKDMIATFPPRLEVEQRFKAVEESIRRVELSVSTLITSGATRAQERRSVNAPIIGVISFVVGGLLLAALLSLFRPAPAPAPVVVPVPAATQKGP